jgi:deoxyribonuclease-4
MEPAAVYEKVRSEIEGLAGRLREKKKEIRLRPETTGKRSSFGTLEEILALSSEIENVLPCLDFAHLHAREGKNNSQEEWALILEQVEEKLGRSGLENLHIHLAGIDFSPAGEKNHLNAEESDLDFKGLLAVLKSYGASGRVICESPNLEDDALLFQGIYRALP